MPKLRVDGTPRKQRSDKGVPRAPRKQRDVHPLPPPLTPLQQCERVFTLRERLQFAIADQRAADARYEAAVDALLEHM